MKTVLHNLSNKLIHTVQFRSMLVSGLIIGSAYLTGCGFQLRGYQTPLAISNQPVSIITEDNRTAYEIKRPLIEQLQIIGVKTNNTDSMNHINDSSIEVKNIEFRKYELVGVLTEFRLIMSADVSYTFYKNGVKKQTSQVIQIERSYQYNGASINVEDQQAQQTRQWLYNALAQRITDQYITLNTQ